ncbi:RNA polymerase sigma factor [Tengunoibacter tsumagoiensis]|uniref:RNA polymerase sigma factor RpoE n=1 Tax=Tengunoibacter tsumagoiensis TaxID=2014871 RepID=A0A401ZTN1_9CHLR|nr:RNA polymerase sigma factor [Tengunoibacter tsumagoiensis]GCE10223.1 RNA polymerase sigma factor RpoE [Tengunoibacter tsumagoiensis]
MKLSEQMLPTLLAQDLRQYFQPMVECYQQRLFIFALRLTGNAQEAEDIVQEAFVHAYLSLKKYPAWRVQTLKLQPWLYKITIHSFDHHVRGARLQVVSSGLFEDSSVIEMEERTEEQPEIIFETQEQQAELEALVAQLPERYRLVITCYYFEQLSYREIAELLDLSLAAVKVNLHRGVKQLRMFLQAQTLVRDKA